VEVKIVGAGQERSSPAAEAQMLIEKLQKASGLLAEEIPADAIVEELRRRGFTVDTGESVIHGVRWYRAWRCTGAWCVTVSGSGAFLTVEVRGSPTEGAEIPLHVLDAELLDDIGMLIVASSATTQNTLLQLLERNPELAIAVKEALEAIYSATKDEVLRRLSSTPSPTEEDVERLKTIWKVLYAYLRELGGDPKRLLARDPDGDPVHTDPHPILEEVRPDLVPVAKLLAQILLLLHHITADKPSILEGALMEAEERAEELDIPFFLDWGRAVFTMLERYGGDYGAYVLYLLSVAEPRELVNIMAPIAAELIRLLLRRRVVLM
jgi:hypothetical protein